MPLILGFGLLALFGLFWTWWALPSDARVRAVALSAVAAGAVGNLADRLADGSVTDFVRVYTEHPSLVPWLVRQFGTSTWPIFNVADAALLVGVALWMLGDLTAGEPLPEADAPS